MSSRLPFRLDEATNACRRENPVSRVIFEGGQIVYGWAMGAVICGRRTYDASVRMSDDLPGDHVRLDPIEVVDTPTATHLSYRIFHQP
jgi:hypothetical protein